jgi:hypothetical protein
LENGVSDRPLVVLCDDQLATATGWRDDLNELPEVTSEFEVAVIKKDQFETDVARLEERRSSLRQGKEADAVSTIFDAAAVLVVDYDLYEYKPEQLLTGDSIAYLARTYSSCGYIVGVNQDRISNPFDLTLVAHRSHSTDLSIGSDQVADPGLWSGAPDRWGRFRPWYWPVLTERARALPRLTEKLAGMLNDPLKAVLGLPRELLDALPRSVLALLDVPGRPDIGDVPLRDWVGCAQMGVRSGDRLADDQQIARVAAARLAKWFERVLLPGQDVLVDAPHLVDRRPGLLDGDTTEPESWQRAARLDASAEQMGLQVEQIAHHRFSGDWVGRPVWIWPRLSSDPALDDTRDAPRPAPRLVFAEDTSRFVEVDSARRYTSDVDPPFSSRWLALPKGGIGYLPAARLAAS